MTKINMIDDIINYIYELNSNVTFYLLDIDITAVLSKTDNFLIDQMNHSDNALLPYTFLSLKYFPRVTSENIIFIDYQINQINLSQPFIDFFSIDTVIRITNEAENSKKMEKGLNIVNIIIYKIEDIVNKKKVLLDIIALIKARNSRSFLLQIDNKNIEIFIYISILFICKLTDITVRRTRLYLTDIFLFNPLINVYTHNEYSK